MKRVGRSNKPGINKAAQAVGKNSQNILDAGALAIQRWSEGVTGKVQKYARMDARLISNWRGGAPKMPSPSRGSRIFVENVYSVLDFFILGGLLGLRKISQRWQRG